MGIITVPTKEPSEPPQQDRWIYSSCFSQDVHPIPLDAPDLHVSPQPASDVTLDSLPEEPRADAPPPSPQPTSIAWSLFKAATGFLTFAKSTERVGRGAQPTTAASEEPRPIEPYMELAMATSKGLRAFIHGLPLELASADKPMSPFSFIDESESDSSYWSSGSDEGQLKGPRYKNIKCDVYIVLRRLFKLRFYEWSSTGSDSPTSSLICQITTYLSSPSDNRSSIQVRWLVLSGHHSTSESKFIIDAKRCFKWQELRKAIGKTPPEVMIVLVLDCCAAETAVFELVDGLRIPNLVVFASCAGGESSNADNGAYFLNAFFKALRPGQLEGTSGEWDDALRLVAEELWKRTDAQHPVLYLKTDLPPSCVLSPLMWARKSSPSYRGRCVPTAAGREPHAENSEGCSVFR